MPRSKADEMAAAQLAGAIRTFDEVFAELNLTPAERVELVHRLAALRYRKTVEALLPRKRAVFPVELRKNWSGGEVQDWLDENVNGGRDG